MFYRYFIDFKGRFNLFFKMKNFYIYFLLILYSFSSCSKEGTGGKAVTPNTFEQFFPFIILGLIFYFLLIRPQQKRHKQHREFLSNIKRGDEVLTNSGIYGQIEGITDEFVILEVAKDVRIRIIKSQISSYTTESKASETTK